MTKGPPIKPFRPHAIGLICTDTELKRILKKCPDTISRARYLLACPPWDNTGVIEMPEIDPGREYTIPGAARLIFNTKKFSFGIDRNPVRHLIGQAVLTPRWEGGRWLIPGYQIQKLNLDRTRHNPIPPRNAKKRLITIRCSLKDCREIYNRHTLRARALWLLNFKP